MTRQVKHFYTMKKGRKYTVHDPDTNNEVVVFDPNLIYRDKLVGTIAMDVVSRDETGNPNLYAVGFAQCSRKDEATKKRGRLVAENRLNKLNEGGHAMPPNHARWMTADDLHDMIDSGKFMGKNLNKFDYDEVVINMDDLLDAVDVE